jgi:hypothetical protein
VVRPTKKTKTQHYLGEERRRYLERLRRDRRSCPAIGHLHPDYKKACPVCNGKVCNGMHAKGLDDAGKPLRPDEPPTCGAKTRAGSTCTHKIIPGKTRCRFHGGKSTGPRTPEGRARLAQAQRMRWAKLRRGEGEG